MVQCVTFKLLQYCMCRNVCFFKWSNVVKCMLYAFHYIIIYLYIHHFQKQQHFYTQQSHIEWSCRILQIERSCRILPRTWWDRQTTRTQMASIYLLSHKYILLSSCSISNQFEASPLPYYHTYMITRLVAQQNLSNSNQHLYSIYIQYSAV